MAETIRRLDWKWRDLALQIRISKWLPQEVSLSKSVNLFGCHILLGGLGRSCGFYSCDPVNSKTRYHRLSFPNKPVEISPPVICPAT